MFNEFYFNHKKDADSYEILDKSDTGVLESQIKERTKAINTEKRSMRRSQSQQIAWTKQYDRIIALRKLHSNLGAQKS